MAAPGSLCSVRAVDKSVLLKSNKMPTEHSVSAACPVLPPNVCLPSASIHGWQEAHRTSQDSCSARWLPCHAPSLASPEQLWMFLILSSVLWASAWRVVDAAWHCRARLGEPLQGDAGAFCLEGDCLAASLTSTSLLYHLPPNCEVKPLKWNFALAGSSYPSAPTTAELKPCDRSVFWSSSLENSS